MFCNKCGTQIPDDSKFCTNCGFSFEKSEPPIKGYNLDTDSIKDFIKGIFKNPIVACEEFSQELTSKFIYWYFAITTVVLSLICSLSFKSVIKSIAKSTAESALGGYETGLEYYLESSIYIDEMLGEVLPFSKIFLVCLIGFAIFFIGIALLSYLFDVAICKEDIKLNEYFTVISVALTIYGTIVVVSMILFMFIPFIGALLLSIGSILNLIILYSGIEKLRQEGTPLPYAFPIIYILSSFITGFFATILMLKHLMNLFMNFI